MEKSPIYTTQVTNELEIKDSWAKFFFSESRIDLLTTRGVVKGSLIKGENGASLLNSPPISPGKYTVTVYSDQNLYGAQIDVTSYSEGKASFGSINNLYKINRRESFRFTFPDSENWFISLFFSYKLNKFRIYDLSSDGLSFEVPESFLVKTGDLIPQVTFNLQGVDFKADIEVRGAFPHKTKKGIKKVGVKFIKIHQGHKWQLTNFVTSCAIKYLKKAI